MTSLAVHPTPGLQRALAVFTLLVVLMMLGLGLGVTRTHYRRPQPVEQTDAGAPDGGQS